MRSSLERLAMKKAKNSLKNKHDIQSISREDLSPRRAVELADRGMARLSSSETDIDSLKDFGFDMRALIEEEKKLKSQSQQTPNTGLSQNGYLGLFDNTELEKELAQPKPKSIAKLYGTKYVSNGKRLASSIVVDVRSYKKETEPEKKTITSIEPGVKPMSLSPSAIKPAGNINRAPAPNTLTPQPAKKPVIGTKKSFFDELLEELEQDDLMKGSGDTLAKKEPAIQKPVEKVDTTVKISPVPKRPVVPAPKPVAKKATKPKKKKKMVDIDIVTGDFGGSDII